MIALILPYASSTLNLSQYVVKVDEIEQKTGIDFFPELEDSLENKLEGEINIDSWNW